jgi:hypothetical protein
MQVEDSRGAIIHTILIVEGVLSGEKKLVFVLNNLNLRMTQNSFHDEYCRRICNLHLLTKV